MTATGSKVPRPGNASLVVGDPALKLVVIADEGEPGTINRVGIEVDGTGAIVAETHVWRRSRCPTRSMTPTPAATRPRTW